VRVGGGDRPPTRNPWTTPEVAPPRASHLSHPDLASGRAWSSLNDDH
jgi:hypothetical protein